MTSPIHEEPIDPSRGRGVAMSFDYEDAPDPGDAKLYWHLYTGVADHPAGRLHLTSLIGESTLPQAPDEPNGLTHVATFDHEPTEDEIDPYIPEEYKP